jgi:predicted AAA+ superfamily ATPase
VLLKQRAAEDNTAFYLSADVLEADDDLFEVVRGVAERYGFRRFLIDEIHFLDDAHGGLKRIYDFLDLDVCFTSSVALAMSASAHDLSRRVRLRKLDWFSFREWLAFALERELPPLSLKDLLDTNWTPEHLRSAVYFSRYLRGGLLPFALEEPEPLPLLENTVAKVIERDIPRLYRLPVGELALLRKLLRFVGRSGIDGISYSSISRNVGITKYKAEQYVAAFDSAFILQRLMPAGTNVLREPKILMVPPLRLLYREADEAVGGLREDFAALSLRQAGIPVQYLKGTRGQKTPDFLVECGGLSVALEIGGPGKGRRRFKGIEADRKLVVSEDPAPGFGRVPLHLLGFLG